MKYNSSGFLRLICKCYLYLPAKTHQWQQFLKLRSHCFVLSLLMRDWELTKEQETDKGALIEVAELTQKHKHRDRRALCQNHLLVSGCIKMAVDAQRGSIVCWNYPPEEYVSVCVCRYRVAHTLLKCMVNLYLPFIVLCLSFPIVWGIYTRSSLSGPKAVAANSLYEALFFVHWNEIRRSFEDAEVWRTLLCTKCMYILRWVSDLGHQIGIINRCSCIWFSFNKYGLLASGIIHHPLCKVFYFDWHGCNTCIYFMCHLTHPQYTVTFYISRMTQNQGYNWACIVNTFCVHSSKKKLFFFSVHLCTHENKKQVFFFTLQFFLNNYLYFGLSKYLNETFSKSTLLFLS